MKKSIFLNALFVVTALLSAPNTHAESANPVLPVLWDQWYTITIKKGNVHYSYYHEFVERTKGRIHFQNDVWKKEEDYINRESLGAFAEDSPDLAPLFYNFRATFRSTETVIDGNVETTDGSKFFVAKAKSKGADLPIVKKSLARNAFFEVYFPVWLGKHLPGLKEGQSVGFSTIMEDDLEHDFELEEGTARLEKPDDIATQTHTRKVSVTYRNMPSIWWITEKGYAERIEMPAQELLIERVPRAKAESFFAGAGAAAAESDN
jgi:hypothetical protein